MTTTTFLDIFFTPHPVYPRDAEIEKKNDKEASAASSSTTAGQAPPLFFIPKVLQSWTGPGNARLTIFRNDPNFSNWNIKVPEEKEMDTLRTEQDVVEAMIVHFISLLASTINIIFNTPIKHSWEVRSNGLRHDVSFRFQISTITKTAMIIELKKQGALKTEQFRSAMFLLSQKAMKRNEAMSMPKDRTLLRVKSNAFWFSKQAAAYAKGWQCNYVALCDYETLILLHYADGLDIPHITIVPRNHFRMALLGFLMEACRFAGAV